MSSYDEQRKALRENFAFFSDNNVVTLSNGEKTITGSTLLSMFRLFYDVNHTTETNGDMTVYMLVKKEYSTLGFSDKFTGTIPASDIAHMDIVDQKERENTQMIIALLQFPESQFMEELYLNSVA